MIDDYLGCSICPLKKYKDKYMKHPLLKALPPKGMTNMDVPCGK